MRLTVRLFAALKERASAPRDDASGTYARLTPELHAEILSGGRQL